VGARDKNRVCILCFLERGVGKKGGYKKRGELEKNLAKIIGAANCSRRGGLVVGNKKKKKTGGGGQKRMESL